MSETKIIEQMYLKPPTHEEIFSFVREVGVPMAHFEQFYGIPAGILKSVKAGFKPLPKKYWKIFYERIIPAYGSFNNFNKPETITPAKVSSVSKKVSILKDDGSFIPNMGDDHTRLTTIK